MNQLEKATAEYQQFTQQIQSIIISTVNNQGMPNGSYTPFVMDEFKNIYIYVSGLSTHTQNLNINPRLSVLFIEDEAKTSQIFARRRLSYDCSASLIERETDEWKKIVDKFQTRFGEIIEMLRGLADFRIFKLTPHNGRFVIGFGAAYHISGDNLDKLVQISKQ
ncbi:pyridoxamine 5'-phosphate oxidase family protein [Plectonema cf. radiosum LEGE 06105]|uniref:Pyridoxamine 5'-phosphate oxidase family protein n=1 Tax=Plectonema cf. radiosum LEGE 06105 TaxID=945769 RepID=A0A8J7K1K4_9CYAN|nr:pyridoxamine 5'-phosphate oxidase family protein [Plectonema radiosum]MBE9214756.1 pyridoxamine 5'-phosphate oxidase family protein [Plectonema cf. radiosum LEGE 06105]